jgi:hypothetical protein
MIAELKKKTDEIIDSPASRAGLTEQIEARGAALWDAAVFRARCDVWFKAYEEFTGHPFQLRDRQGHPI